MADDCPKCEGGLPPWLATFADLMSLLMCFFVLLLSFATIDAVRFKKMAESMKDAFGVQREIPANEIVIPTVLMLTVLVTGLGAGEGAGVMFELDSASDTASILKAGGWTLLTGVNLMLFSLLHNPCSTTIYTIYKETKSARWTFVASVLPLVLGFIVTFLVAQVWRILA